MPLGNNALQNYGEELSDLIHFYGKKKRISNDEYLLLMVRKLKKNGIWPKILSRHIDIPKEVNLLNAGIRFLVLLISEVNFPILPFSLIYH